MGADLYEEELDILENENCEENDEFYFVGCESFNPNFEKSTSLFDWYKVGKT